MIYQQMMSLLRYLGCLEFCIRLFELFDVIPLCQLL